MDPPACVIDNGSYEVRAGLAGDEMPRYVATGAELGRNDPATGARSSKIDAFSLELRVLVADEIYSIKNQAHLEVTRPLERGVLVNAGCQRDIWARCFEKIGATPSETKCFVTESALGPPSAARRCDEILFEEFGFIGRCRAPALACAAAAAQEVLRDRARFLARPAGGKPLIKTPPGLEQAVLVVDAGHASTTVAPVVEGALLQRHLRRSDVGGQLVTGYIRELVSYRQMDVSDEAATLDAAKRDLGFVSQDFDADLRLCDGTTREYGSAGPVYAEFVLPDYHSVERGHARLDARGVENDPNVKRRRTKADHGPQFLRMESERFCAPELHFSPQDIGLEQCGGRVLLGGRSSTCGLPEAVADVLCSVPPALRGALTPRIVLCGGESKLPGFAERLRRDLRPLVQEPFVVDVVHPRDPELLAFQGAALLAPSAGLYLSRYEWQEHGPDRCSRSGIGPYAASDDAAPPATGAMDVD